MKTSRLRLVAAAVFALGITISVALLVILDPVFQGSPDAPGISPTVFTIDTVTANGEHHVVINGLEVAAADSSTWESSLASAALLELPRYFFQDPGRMLVIGLENPAVLRYYALHGWQVDAVEADRRLCRIAETLFGVDTAVARLSQTSPLQFLQEHASSYRIILVQGSGTRTVPPSMVTDSTVRLLTSHLDDDGVVAITVLSIGWQSRLVRSVARTLRSSLPVVTAFPIAEPPTEPHNVLIVAGRQGISLRRGLEQDIWREDYRFSGQYEKNHSWDNRFEPSEEGSVIITADNNPMAGWNRETQRAVRRALQNVPRKQRF